MSRDALPPVPSVQGMPARYDATTFARTWEEPRETWFEHAHPEPLQRAIEVAADAACVPSNARKAARYATGHGFSVRITHAVGYVFDPKTGGVKTRAVMEPIGDGSMTEGARPRLRTYKVGEVPVDPMNSLRVAIRTPDLLLAGHWLDGRWDFGLVLSGHLLVANCNWSRWEEALNAEGGKNMRGQVLPLESDDGTAL